jgi:drug/metabolite transporter (DMT)-like permease
MRTPLSSPPTGYILAAAAMIALGSSVAASSVLVDYPVLTGQAIRYALGAAILVAIARRRLVRPRPAELLLLIALAALGLVGFNVCLLAALRESEPAIVGITIGAVPVVLAVIGPLVSGKRPDGRIVGAALVVTTGVAAVQWGEARSSVLGLLFALGALVCEAAFSLLAMPLLTRLRPMGVATYTSALAVPVLLALALAFDRGELLEIPAADELAALAYLGAVVTAAAFLAWYSSIERLSVARAGLFAGIVPIAALATSAAIGTAFVTPLRLVGAFVVCAGVTIGARAAGSRVRLGERDRDPLRLSDGRAP